MIGTFMANVSDAIFERIEKTARFQGQMEFTFSCESINALLGTSLDIGQAGIITVALLFKAVGVPSMQKSGIDVETFVDPIFNVPTTFKFTWEREDTHPLDGRLFDLLNRKDIK